MYSTKQKQRNSAHKERKQTRGPSENRMHEPPDRSAGFILDFAGHKRVRTKPYASALHRNLVSLSSSDAVVVLGAEVCSAGAWAMEKCCDSLAVVRAALYVANLFNSFSTPLCFGHCLLFAAIWYQSYRFLCHPCCHPPRSCNSQL